MFALTLAPAVISATRARSQGVAAGPWTPAASASAMARATISRTYPSDRASAAGTGLHRTIPASRPRAACAATTRAAAATSGTDMGAGIPLRRAQKNGISSSPSTSTGTPRVSRYSRVRGTSRMAFGPAQTTATGVRASSSRSAEMSNDGLGPSRAPRWTPPIPPVLNTRIPAAREAIIVADTVVADHPPAAAPSARLWRETLRTEPAGAVASASSSSMPRPTSRRPSFIATVAGTAPEPRTAASDAVATSTFCG